MIDTRSLCPGMNGWSNIGNGSEIGHTLDVAIESHFDTEQVYIAAREDQEKLAGAHGPCAAGYISIDHVSKQQVAIGQELILKFDWSNFPEGETGGESVMRDSYWAARAQRVTSGAWWEVTIPGVRRYAEVECGTVNGDIWVDSYPGDVFPSCWCSITPSSSKC